MNRRDCSEAVALAFFGALKQKSDYLQFRPYRAIVAPKLRPQRERDRLAYRARKQNRLSKSSTPTRARSRILFFVVFLIVLAICCWMGLSAFR